MISKGILIDTNIWHFAYIIPQDKVYLYIHKKAKDFIEKTLKDIDIKIVISEYQIIEIISLLNKYEFDNDSLLKIFNDFYTEKYEIYKTNKKILEEAIKKSTESKIHLYDYLVVLPGKDAIDKIYSADGHFQHKDFTSICEVINPLGWILREGKNPVKK